MSTYIKTKKEVYLLSKYNTLQRTIDVHPISLDNDGNCIHDKDAIITIENNDVLFSTSSFDIIKDDVDSYEEKILDKEACDDYFSQELHPETYDDLDYYIPLL